MWQNRQTPPKKTDSLVTGHQTSHSFIKIKMAAGGWRPPQWDTQYAGGGFPAPNVQYNQMTPPHMLPSLMQGSGMRPNVPNSRGSHTPGRVPNSGSIEFHSNRTAHFKRSRGSSSSIRETGSSNLPEDYKFAGMEVQARFPSPKEKLHNILQTATKQHKGANYTHRYVNGQYWQATVNITWPEPMSFTGEGFEKRSAERRAAALACDHLMVNL